jgi:hypothetical protein
MAQAFNLAKGSVDFTTIGPNAADVIDSHIPNNSFAAAVPGPLTLGTNRDDPVGHTDNCPYWTAWTSSGAGTATVVADVAYPGGKYVECKFSAIGSLTSNNVVLTTDLFPLARGMQVSPGSVEGVNVPLLRQQHRGRA